MERLSEDLVLKLLQHLPELECWGRCELVCRSWRDLLRDNRTRIRVVLTQQSAVGVDSNAECLLPSQLMCALQAAERSSQPITEISIHCDAVGLTPRFWSDVEHAAFLRVVTRAACALEVVSVTAPSGFFPPADDALDPAMAALSEAALADTSRLRYLDLSWTNAATGEAIGRLLSHCCASSHGGEITLEALRLGGCTQLCSSGVGLMAAMCDGLGAVAPHIRELSLPSCFNPSIDVPASICPSCVALTSLDLSQVLFTPAGLRQCLDHPQLRRGLRRLRMAGHTGLPSRVFAHVLTVCERLHAIDFSASLIGDDALREAAMHAPGHLSHLRDVRLTECSSITDDGVAELCGAAGAALRALALGGAFSPLTSAAAVSIGKRCVAPLTQLTMQCCRVGEAGLAALAPIGAHFEHLDLSNSPSLEPGALATLLRRGGPGCGARLRVLALRACSLAVTDEILASFLPRAHALEHLDVAHCFALTDVSCVLLATARARALRHLRVLDVTGCMRFTPRGRAQLQRSFSPRVLRWDELDDERSGAVS